MSGSKRAKSHTLSLCLTGICIIFLRKFFFFKINRVEIELLIQRSDQFISNKEVRPSRLYFELGGWGGRENNFLKPKFKKLIKYYILLFCFINSRGGTAPQGHQIALSLVLVSSTSKIFDN